MNTAGLSVLVETHKHCPKCGVLVPVRFLSCPSCLGFQKKHEQWTVPGKPKAKRKPVRERSMFDVSQEDYPS